MSVLDLFRLDGKVVLVTGASSGLGVSFAQGFAGAGANSRVELATMPDSGLPDGAISTLMHCRTVKADQTLAWDIALIIGYHRGVLVTAEYTPGPQGGAFDSQLASGLGVIYRAQIQKLDA